MNTRRNRRRSRCSDNCSNSCVDRLLHCRLFNCITQTSSNSSLNLYQICIRLVSESGMRSPETCLGLEAVSRRIFSVLVLVLRIMFSTSVLQLPVTCSLLNVTCITYRQSDCFALFPVLNFSEIGLPYHVFRLYLFPDHVNNVIFIWCLGLGLGTITVVQVSWSGLLQFRGPHETKWRHNIIFSGDPSPSI